MIIGTRGSALALAQAETVCAQIAKLVPGKEVRLETIKTLGDRLPTKGDLPLETDQPQGIFTRRTRRGPLVRADPRGDPQPQGRADHASARHRVWGLYQARGPSGRLDFKGRQEVLRVAPAVQNRDKLTKKGSANQGRPPGFPG